MIKIDKLIKERIFSKKNVFLKYIYFFLNKIFSTFKYRKSFSQGSMDLILQHIFKDKKNGIYVDVGCQNPISNLNFHIKTNQGLSHYAKIHQICHISLHTTHED